MGKRDEKLSAVKVTMEAEGEAGVEWTHEVIVVNPPAPAKPKTPFSQWFHRKVKAGEVRAYEEKALKVYFGEQGLKAEEDSDSYDKAFESY